MSTTNRRLETLSLLQAHPGISATQLAARLGVTERTARRDVAHLRELGYRIDAEAGLAGGYQLASGRTMPPLLLDADEVAAVVLGLRAAVTVEGIETAAITALAKLTQVVPSRWHTRLTALADVQARPEQSRRRAGRDVLIPAAFVSDTLAHGPRRHRVRVQVHTSADLVRELVDPSVATVIDNGDECELHFGTDDLDWAARWLAYLNLDIDVIEPTSLTGRLRALGRWLLDRY